MSKPKISDSVKIIYDGKSEGKPEEVEEFLKDNLPPGDHGEIEEEMKKPFNLRSTKSRSKGRLQPVIKKNFLNASLRRASGLFKFFPSNAGLNYYDFIHLHSLWKSYMKELLSLDKYEHKPQEGESVLQTKICRADYHGAKFKITKSKCAGNLGISGLVVMETRNTFRIIVKKNSSIKTIPKAGTSFSFKLDGYLFTLYGSNLICKPGERAVKKWKNKIPFDL